MCRLIVGHSGCIQTLKSAWISVECLKSSAWFLILPWKWWFFLEKCLKMTICPWNIKHPDILLFFMFLYLRIIINESHCNEKTMPTKGNFHLPILSDLWLDGKLHTNSRFCRVTLNFFIVTLLEWHWKCSWKLHKYPWKSPWKCLNFFLEIWGPSQ